MNKTGNDFGSEPSGIAQIHGMLNSVWIQNARSWSTYYTTLNIHQLSPTMRRDTQTQQQV